jgi:hypothetical protein
MTWEISRSYISLRLDIDTNSPAAIENDPASSPATPASRIALCEEPAPATGACRC